MPVPDEDLRLLLDQNVPQAISTLLKKKLPGWEILHVNELGFQGKPPFIKSRSDFIYVFMGGPKFMKNLFDENLRKFCTNVPYLSSPIFLF